MDSTLQISLFTPLSYYSYYSYQTQSLADGRKRYRKAKDTTGSLWNPLATKNLGSEIRSRL